MNLTRAYNNAAVYGGASRPNWGLSDAWPGGYFDPDVYARSIPTMFEHVRSAIGFDTPPRLLQGANGSPTRYNGGH